jgi:hypothetical protein
MAMQTFLLAPVVGWLDCPHEIRTILTSAKKFKVAMLRYLVEIDEGLTDNEVAYTTVCRGGRGVDDFDSTHELISIPILLNGRFELQDREELEGFDIEVVCNWSKRLQRERSYSSTQKHSLLWV